ncbi:ATP synthase subunit I [Salsuginibacillus kocurii]|uniref:ATP synthase subunit I n=1 Tax=Salsuginibacillus kocurii TaxID=427078 RepID=UPI000375ADA4|nr:ATP synthase subunit I [Salsuginibacillus kocurii]
MTDFSMKIRLYVQWSLYLTAFYVLGWGFTDYTTIFAGLVLGAVFALYNLWSMYSKVKKLGQTATEGKRFLSLGTFSRLAVAVLAVLIVIRFPELFHPVGVVIGLMTPYIVILVHAILQIRHL